MSTENGAEATEKDRLIAELAAALQTLLAETGLDFPASEEWQYTLSPGARAARAAIAKADQR